MPIQRISSPVLLLLAVLFVGPMTGCIVPWARGIRSLEESVTDWRDFVWGQRAFNQRYGNSQSGPFKDGFLEGYHDILSGGDGCLPVVPPKRYWGWRYQSANGQGAINEWFAGFQAGVAAAKEDGLAGLSCIPLCSQYNGMSTVPIEAVPTEEGQMMDPQTPNAIPTPPSVEPPGLKTRSRAIKQEQETLKRDAKVRPASAEQAIKKDTPLPAIVPMSSNLPIRNNVPLSSSPTGASHMVPLGTGTVDVIPVHQVPDPNSTSRRGKTSTSMNRRSSQPGASMPGPWNLKPMFPGGQPASNR